MIKKKEKKKFNGSESNEAIMVIKQSASRA